MWHRGRAGVALRRRFGVSPGLPKHDPTGRVVPPQRAPSSGLARPGRFCHAVLGLCRAGQTLDRPGMTRPNSVVYSSVRPPQPRRRTYPCVRACPSPPQPPPHDPSYPPSPPRIPATDTTPEFPTFGCTVSSDLYTSGTLLLHIFTVTLQ